MTSRDTILAAVRAARPAAVARPDARRPALGDQAPRDVVLEFTEAALAAGARVTEGRRTDLRALIADAYPHVGRRVSAMEALDPLDDSAPTPHSFADADLFVCEAVLGVAENGAVWLPDSRLRHRSAVFLATNVIVVLDRSRIVDDMHAAYAEADVAREGYGVFVAGPSKTADIEQSLVIGAHGAKSLTVLLVQS